MPSPHLPRLRPGQTPTAAEWNELCDLVGRAGMVTGTAFGDTGTATGLGGVQVLDGRVNGHWAKIGARGTGATYAHTSAASNGDGTFTDLPATAEYEFGTTTSTPAREVNGSTDVPVGEYEWLWPDPTGTGGYLFESPPTNRCCETYTATIATGTFKTGDNHWYTANGFPDLYLAIPGKYRVFGWVDVLGLLETYTAGVPALAPTIYVRVVSTSGSPATINGSAALSTTTTGVGFTGHGVWDGYVTITVPTYLNLQIMAAALYGSTWTGFCINAHPGPSEAGRINAQLMCCNSPVVPTFPLVPALFPADLLSAPTGKKKKAASNLGSIGVGVGVGTGGPTNTPGSG